jgi:hypothetical protein
MTMFNWGPQHRLYAICNALPDAPRDDIKVTKLDTLFPCSPACEAKPDTSLRPSPKLFGKDMQAVNPEKNPTVFTWELLIGPFRTEISCRPHAPYYKWQAKVGEDNHSFQKLRNAEAWLESKVSELREGLSFFFRTPSTPVPAEPTKEPDSKYVKLFGQPLTRVCKNTWNLDLGFISATIQFDTTNTLEPWYAKIIGSHNKTSRNFSDILDVERWAEIQLISICEEILKFVPPTPKSRQKPTSNITNVPRVTPKLFGQNMIADATGWVLRLGDVLAKISYPAGESQWVAALGQTSEKFPTMGAAETWIELRASEMYSTLGSFVFNRPAPALGWLPLPEKPIDCNAFVVKHAGHLIRCYLPITREKNNLFISYRGTGSHNLFTWEQILREFTHYLELPE